MSQFGTAYVDTSFAVAIAFGEPTAQSLIDRLLDFEVCVSSNLLEAEFQAAVARERRAFDFDSAEWLKRLQWVLPDRPLRAEIVRTLAAGYVRGADCWHLASALYVSGDPGSLTFLTLGAKQRKVAATLGFTT